MDVVFCNCAYSDVIPAHRKERILAALAASDANLVVVPDLCGLAATRDPLLARIAGMAEAKIVACYPRAVRWLFHRGGAPLPPGHAEILNMREQSAEDIIASLSLSPGTAGPGLTQAAGRDGEWIPWFPVIDYERCTNCRQCLEFCLFGVYEPDEGGRVKVAKPASCKTNCPACARICPNAAIVFPKVEDSPINGAEVENEDQVHAMAKVNVDRILGDDVYAALARRKAKRTALLLKPVAPEGDGQ
jgi:NAD-dependent dihydropyrimidine dehydrogenase PreA subunit